MKRLGIGLMVLVLLSWCTALACGSERPFHWRWRAAYQSGCHWYAGYWWKDYYDPPAAVVFVTYSVSIAPESAGVQPLPLTAPLDGRVVLVKRCSKCHDNASFEDMGGEFALIAKLDKLKKYEVRKIKEKIALTDPNKRMPPAAPLPAAERKAVEAFLDSPSPKE